MPIYSQKGVTLIESVCAMAVLSLVAAIATPHAQQLHHRMIADSLLASLSTDIAFARMSAISKGRPTVICPSPDGHQCHGGTGWNEGWIVFLDNNRDRVRQLEERILSVAQMQPKPLLAVTSTGGRRTIRLYPDGMSHGSNLTITVTLHGATHARLIMNNAGRVRIERPQA